MTSSRRAFLCTLAAAAAGAVLDPERLLWVPGQKTIFLPPVSRWDDSIDGMLALVDNGTISDTYVAFYRINGFYEFKQGGVPPSVIIL